MDKTKLLFVDVNTQKCFVEHFGALAVPDCPDIRENLMELTYLGPENGVQIASLMYAGLDCEEGSAEYDKVNDSEALSNQVLFKHESLKLFECDEFENFLNEKAIKTVFVYGVPLDKTVMQACIWLKTKVEKVWIVTDAVKSYDGDEQKHLDMLKSLGVKTITTRNLESFINY